MKKASSLKFVSVFVITNGIENYHGPTTSSSGGGDGRILTIEIPVVIDAREFGRAVKKVVLEDIGIHLNLFLFCMCVSMLLYSYSVLI